jgi:Flp pilus assembly protein TadD
MQKLFLVLILLLPYTACRGAHDNPHTARHVKLGAAALREQEPELAQRHFELALQFDARDPRALVGMGVVQFLEGEYRRARWFFEEAIRQQPDNPEAHANLGALLWTLDQLEPALRHLKTALYLDPGNDAARWNLAMILMERREFSAAAVHLGWYCARKNHPPEGLLQWARALRAAGQPGRAGRVMARLAETRVPTVSGR